ncbi:MAG TPA: hypothetical protein VFJ90_15490 [Candidatus Didemnitutus sp.]|nr:hypothetical protein [Candidatus Didemnitutus sp.]
MSTPPTEPTSPSRRPLQGFGSRAYAHALAEFGTPGQLARSGGWYLRRAIPGAAEWDGLGNYPFFMCEDWSGLAEDLAEAGRDLVSFAAVPDPFGAYDVELLRRAFPDVCVHFKDHFVADLSRPADEFISSHHRLYARKALQQVTVEFTTAPLPYLDRWMALFGLAVQKFQITGLRAYSRESFARQFAVEGVVMSLARFRDEIVAMHVQYMDGDVAFAHMAASNQTGYKVGAAYALYDAEIRYFAGKVRWLDWGGEPGVAPGSKGLSSFKAGWSTGTKPAYFCGRIFQPARYQQLAESKGALGVKYFPAYRQGELG